MVAVLVTVGLTVFDMGSDILLAVNYANTGKDNWWFALTLTFFLIPFIFLLLIIILVCIEREIKSIIAEFFPYWKQFECTTESGPQLILQLYIMSLPSMDVIEDPGIESSTLFQMNATFNNQSEVTSVTHPITFTETRENGTTSNIKPVDENNFDDIVTFALQVLVIVTALLSISWGAVSLKIGEEQDNNGKRILERYWGPVDYVCDMTWNLLCISSRVITLALFASSERYWFAGIIITHSFIALLIYVLLIRNTEEYRSYNTKFGSAAKCISLAISSIFNISLAYEESLRTYRIYVYYWIVMMVQNTILISIWYALGGHDGLWYHTPAIVYIILAYFISFFIKTYQTYQLKKTKTEYINKGKAMSEWIC